jgi:hypothetical protein
VGVSVGLLATVDVIGIVIIPVVGWGEFDKPTLHIEQELLLKLVR